MSDYIKKNKLLLLVLIPAFLTHMLIIMPSGSSYCHAGKCGIYFWGAHAHDAIWHLAIISSSFSKIPFISPTFSGSLLSGYNYLLDLVMFILYKIGISPLFSYFKLFPLLWFLAITASAVSFARKLHKSPLFVGIFFFFTFFAGSFSYFLTLYHHKTIWGSSGLLSMQSALTLTNLQFAFSLAVLLYILTLIKGESKNILLLSSLTAINLALKFYAGAISIVLVSLYLLGSFLKDKNVKALAISFITLILISTVSLIIFYNPQQSLQSGSTFSFSPMATVHSIIEEPEQFYMKDMVNARYFLQGVNKFSPKLIRIELYSLALFLIFNFGTRVIGFILIGFKIVKRSISRFEMYVLLTMIFGIFMATFFVQKGIWWNTIQFLYYALFLGNIFAAEALYDGIKKWKIPGFVFAVVIVLLTIPTTLDVVRGFSSFPSPAYLPKEELAALEFLKKQPAGVVVAPLYDKTQRKELSTPYALAHYDDTSYVTAFSGKPSYAADDVQLQLLGLSYKNRYEALKNGDCSVIKSVQYIYQPTDRHDMDICIKHSSTIREIYRNRAAVIYSTKK